VSARASKDGRPTCPRCRKRKVALIVHQALPVEFPGPGNRVQHLTTGRCKPCGSKGLTGVVNMHLARGWRVSPGLWTKIPVRP
jgi:hypothetical protein